MELPNPTGETDQPPIDPAPVVERLARHLDVAREGVDPEGVHQVRVACRQLLVWLQMARRRALRSDLRWLRQSAADVRDLDVLITRTLPEDFRTWLSQERRAAHARLERTLDSTRTAGLMTALGWLRPIPLEAAQREADRLRELVAERGAALALPAADAHQERARLHDLRRALRRLRYALAWADQDRRELRRLQNVLGGLNDLELLYAQLERFPDRERCPEFVADVEARAAAAHAASLEAWRRSREAIAALALERRGPMHS